MTNTTAAQVRTANIDVLMGDTVIVQGHAHVITDEPVYVRRLGHQMIRWTLRPAADSQGVIRGIWDVWPNEQTNVLA